MPNLSPEAVGAALQRCLIGVSPDVTATPVSHKQNLLELIDSFGFVELLTDLERTLEIELELEGVDLAEMVHVENLIAIVCQQAVRTESGMPRPSTS